MNCLTTQFYHTGLRWLILLGQWCKKPYSKSEVESVRAVQRLGSKLKEQVVLEVAGRLPDVRGRTCLNRGSVPPLATHGRKSPELEVRSGVHSAGIAALRLPRDDEDR